jgi:hypothetical protein
MGPLELAVADWRNAPFPPGSGEDDLDELHADLALADTWVAESTIPYLERGVVALPPFDVKSELEKLEHRALSLAEKSAAAERALADSYVRYVGLLIRVFDCLAARLAGDK